MSKILERMTSESCIDPCCSIRDGIKKIDNSAMFISKELQMPFLKIGELFSKDHSTVMSSVKLMQKALDNSERDVIDPLESIRKRLRQ